ncbi:MAG: acyl carrier protein [Acidimicrobiales bacterium]
MDDDVTRRLEAVFRDVFMDDDVTISAATTTDDVVGWDSVAHISLIYAIEEEFGIEFAADDIEALANVGELAAVIRQLTCSDG